MTTATATGEQAATPASSTGRAARLARGILAFVAGVVIAATANLHEDLGFDRAMVSVTLACFVVGALWETFTVRGQRRALSLCAALFALAGAVVALLTGSAVTLSIVIAAWAVATGLLEFISSAVRGQGRGDAVFAGALLLLLALSVLLSREDEVAVIGFLGAYAIVTGVFAGISAFDSRGGRAVSQGQTGQDARNGLTTPQH